MQIIWWARFSDGNQRAQPVLEWPPASSGVETGCHMDWADYLRDEAAKYRQLAKAAEDLSIKQELLDLAAVCEEAADNIEDAWPCYLAGAICRCEIGEHIISHSSVRRAQLFSRNWNARTPVCLS
jgi:hypothetical protein